MKTRPSPRKPAPKRGVALGLGRFATISAVEGIRLTAEMQSDFQEMERLGLTPDARRRYLAEKYGKKSA